MNNLTMAWCALLLVGSVNADFCDGKRFGLIDLGMAERILDARAAVNDEIGALTEARLYRHTDIEPKEQALRATLRQRHQSLTQDTEALCRDWQAASGQAVSYQGLNLAGEFEVRAQLRFNLAEYQTGLRALALLSEREQAFAELDQALDRQRVELSLLDRHLQALAVSPSAAGAERVIADTCNLLRQSRALRTDFDDRDLNELLEAIRARSVDLAIDEQAFAGNCQLNGIQLPTPATKPQTVSQSAWWRLW